MVLADGGGRLPLIDGSTAKVKCYVHNLEKSDNYNFFAFSDGMGANERGFRGRK
jgi:hypothetical protein